MTIPFLPSAGATPRTISQRVNQAITRFLHRTDETVAGVWQDDKPIYRKVLTAAAGPNATTQNNAHSISNLDKVVTIKAVLDNGTDQIPVPNYDGTNYSYIKATDTNAVITTNWNASAYGVIIELEYTKTTD